VKLPFERAAVIARFEANGRAVMEVSGAALGIAMKFKGEGGWPTNPMGKFWASRPGMGVY
jgi:hypothetical protein